MFGLTGLARLSPVAMTDKSTANQNETEYMLSELPNSLLRFILAILLKRMLDFPVWMRPRFHSSYVSARADINVQLQR